MATPWSSSPVPAAAAPASAKEDSGSHWAPHGTVLTACVVGINVLVILLIYFFFWRFFSGKPAGSSATGGEDDDELPVASPWAFRLRRNNAPRRPPPQHEDVAASLPVYVYSSSGAGGDGGDGAGKAPECAVCIVELRDGDAARRLPRCGHRFHADCVGEWLRLHATCPLCRANVVAPSTEPMNPRDAAVGADCPV